MKTGVNQRLNDVVNYLIFSKAALDKSDLSKKLGYNASSFSQIINERVPLTDRFISRLVEFAPNINKDWLLTGEGTMLKVPAATMTPIGEQQVDCPARPMAGRYIGIRDKKRTAAQLINIANTLKAQGVTPQMQVATTGSAAPQVLINGVGKLLDPATAPNVTGTLPKVQQSATPTEAMRDGVNVITNAAALDLSIIPAEVVEEIKEEVQKSAVVLPPIIPDNIAKKPNLDVMEWIEEENEHQPHAIEIASRIKRTKAIFQVPNNTMSPILHQGEYLFLKPFLEGQLFTDGDVYVIDTKQRGMMVYALYDKGDHILCRPKNNLEYADLCIEKENVIRLYHILFHGSTHIASIPDLDRQQYAKQGQQIDDLIAQIDKAGEREERLIHIIEKKLL